MTAEDEAYDMTDHRDRSDSRAPRLRDEPIDRAEAKEPMLAIDRAEPMEPIDRTDPREPMHSNES
jgi:hypothetical protein